MDNLEKLRLSFSIKEHVSSHMSLAYTSSVYSFQRGRKNPQKALLRKPENFTQAF